MANAKREVEQQIDKELADFAKDSDESEEDDKKQSSA